MKRLTMLLCVFGLASAAAAREPEKLAADFDRAVPVNNLGGRFNAYKAGASAARVDVVGNERYGSRGGSLLIRAHRRATGFCGLWMHLFRTADPQAAYLDATGYDYLSFWVKGARGGEHVAEILKTDLENNMVQLGCRTIEELREANGDKGSPVLGD